MIFFEGRCIALIGGAGFIGHNLALEFKGRGAHVEIIDSLQVNNLLYFVSNVMPNRDLYLRMLHERIDLLHRAGIPLHMVDARDYAKLSQTLNKIRPQVIVHLAAVAHANRSNKDPYSTFDHSLRTLENALDYARGTIEHFIYFSSSMVYGHFNSGVAKEDMACNPIGIYGALKYSGEKFVIAYNQVFNLPYTIVRPSALYGERCVSRRVGQILIENAIKGKPININGNGSDALDFTYIDDVVAANLLAMESPKVGKGEIINIGAGNSKSVNEVAAFFSHPTAHIAPRVEPHDTLADITRAKVLLGWEPRISFEEGLERTMEWFKSEKGG